MHTNIQAKLKQNYFEFFNLPLEYEINLIKLKKSFLAAQTQYHPDKLLDYKLLANQLSAYTNEAFNTLKNPAQRAIYWCKLHNINIKIQIDIEILEQTIQWHEELEQQEKNHISQNILSKAKQTQNEYYKKFADLAKIDKYNQELGKYAQTLLMIDRFIKNIDDKI